MLFEHSFVFGNRLNKLAGLSVGKSGHSGSARHQIKPCHPYSPLTVMSKSGHNQGLLQGKNTAWHWMHGIFERALSCVMNTWFQHTINLMHAAVIGFAIIINWTTLPQVLSLSLKSYPTYFFISSHLFKTFEWIFPCYHILPNNCNCVEKQLSHKEILA